MLKTHHTRGAMHGAGCEVGVEVADKSCTGQDLPAVSHGVRVMNEQVNGRRLTRFRSLFHSSQPPRHSTAVRPSNTSTRTMSFMHPYEWQNAQIIARQHLAAQLQQHASQAQAPHHLAAPQPQPPPSHQLEQPIGSSKRAASPTFESNKNKSTRRESPPPPTVEPVARTRFDYKVFRTANTTLEQTKE